MKRLSRSTARQDVDEDKKTLKQTKPILGGLFDLGPDRSHPAYEAGYVLVDTKKKLGELVDKLKRVSMFSVDTETTSVNPMEAKLCGISISLGERDGARKRTLMSMKLCKH